MTGPGAGGGGGGYAKLNTEMTCGCTEHRNRERLGEGR